MIQAMLAGVASIKAQQTRMNIIGNNLANINTTAFKGGRVTFQDMMSQTLRGASSPNGAIGGRNPIQVGLGVRVASTDTNTEQGSLNATNRPTDMAITGNGFFPVTDGNQILYTRDGGFDLDANGDLVHRATGTKLIGWTADPVTGAVDTSQALGAASTLNIPLGAAMTAQATSQATWAGNLDNRAAVGDTSSTVVRVYDNLGNAHDLNVTYTKTSADTWDWSVTNPGGSAAVTGSGTITFDPANGSVMTGNTGAITVTPTDGAAVTINADFGSLKGLAADSNAKVISQNGFGPGSLASFAVAEDGSVVGLYSNGMTKTLGQVALASFSNPGGLDREGGNLWTATYNSGTPTLGTALSDDRGSITSGYLEQSNVDIGTEFTDLIITQRGFQANTKVVTTVDEMLQELLQMKR